MFNQKKLTKEDLEESRKRTELINQYILVAQALEIQKQIFIKNLLPKYNCDLSRNYNINLKNGKITEIQNQGRPTQNIPQ